MLVNYPDSSSESDHDNQSWANPAPKRKAETEPFGTISKKPPPLPSAFHSLYTAAARTSTSDDPSLHAGRTRQVPHVVGNWPTHVYLEWYPPPSQIALLDSIISQASFNFNRGGTISAAGSSIHTFLRSDLGALLPLHISLSAPLVLRTEQKALFQESLDAQLEQLRVNSFAVNVVGLDWVSNHDGTRFFLVLRLSQPKDDQLNELLNACNNSARQFDLTQLYADPGEAGIQANNKCHNIPDRSSAFHISVAWTLQKPTAEAGDRLSQTVLDQCQGLEIKFDCIKLKIGNTVLDILLDKRESNHAPKTSINPLPVIDQAERSQTDQNR